MASSHKNSRADASGGGARNTDADGDTGDGGSREAVKFPYPEEQFTECLRVFSAAFIMPKAYKAFDVSPLGLFYDTKSGKLKALVIFFESIYSFRYLLF